MAFTLLPAVDIADGRAVLNPRAGRGRCREARSVDPAITGCGKPAWRLNANDGVVDGGTVHDADPVDVARRFSAAGAEWLHVVDLDAAATGEPRNRHLIERVVDATGCRVQASGGVRTLADVEASLGFGAERVVIGTMALTDPDLVRAVLDTVGPRIAVGLDARGRTLQARGWTEEVGDLFEALEIFAALGVPRFVYTDIARDGMLEGPNVEMLCQVADATDAPVTASGGVSRLDDLRVLASCHERVDAAIVGTALFAGAFTIDEALAAAV